MVSTLKVSLLGEFRLVYGDDPVTGVNSARLQSLLAYLILHRNAPQSRQHLAFLFWLDSTEAQARTNLRRELHHLRRALPNADHFLHIDAKTLQWRPDAPFTLDVADFEAAVALADKAEQQADRASVQAALEKAVGIYQGDLLPNCYEEWILSEQERLHQQCLRTLERLIQVLQEQQDYEAAISYAQQLLQCDPLREATYRRLMHLHARNGDRASALRTYHRCQTILQQELDVEPSATTHETYESLQRGEEFPLQQSVNLPVLTKASVTVGQPLSHQLSLPSMVGREEEWATIQSWMMSTVKNTSREILLLMGEPGIGKTRLLEELRAEIGTGQVLWGRGFEVEMVRPYGAWIDAIRSVLPTQVSGLPEDLSYLLPEIATTSEIPSDRSRLFDAVVQLLAQLSANNQFTLVVLDDLQWLDEASIALLHYALRLLADSPVQFACAARPRELEKNAPAIGLLQALRREQRIKTMELTPLGQDSIITLAHSVDAGVDGDRVFTDSGGNPLFALEVARAIAHPEGSNATTLTVLIQDRLLQLDDTARELLSWAATLGRSFNPTILARIADSSLAQLLPAIEQLEQHGIICPSNDSHGEIGYDFAHDIVRQVAYQQLSEPRRRLVHLHIAHALEQMTASDRALASDVAHHAALGGDRQLATSASLAAAERCLQLFAYAEAAELAQRGMQHCQQLDDCSRVRLHIALLRVYISAGVTQQHVPQLEDELHQLIAEANTFGLKDEEAMGFELISILHFDHDNFSSVHKHSLQTAEISRAASPGTTARLLAHSGSCLAAIGREMQRAEALLLEAQSLASRVEMQMSDIPLGLGCIHHYRGEFAIARQLLEQAWQIAHTQAYRWQECFCLVRLAMLELEAGNPTVALTWCQKLATAATKIGEGSEGPFATALDALARYSKEQSQAERALEQALSTLRQIDTKRMLAYILTFAAEIDLDYDRAELAIARAQEARQVAKVVEHPSEIALAWAVLIRGRLAQGNWTLAKDDFQGLQKEMDNRALSARARTALADLAQKLTF